MVWVGFELLHRSFQLGISQCRAEWFTCWTLEISKSDFEQGVGCVTACRGCIGVREAILGSPVQIHVPPSKGFCPASPGLCVLRAVVAFQIGCWKSSSPVRRRVTTILFLASCGCTSVFDSDGGRVVGCRTSTPTGFLTSLVRLGFRTKSQPRNGRGYFEKGDKPSLIIVTLEALTVLLTLKTLP